MTARMRLIGLTVGLTGMGVAAVGMFVVVLSAGGVI